MEIINCKVGKKVLNAFYGVMTISNFEKPYSHPYDSGVQNIREDHIQVKDIFGQNHIFGDFSRLYEFEEIPNTFLDYFKIKYSEIIKDYYLYKAASAEVNNMEIDLKYTILDFEKEALKRPFSGIKKMNPIFYRDELLKNNLFNGKLNKFFNEINSSKNLNLSNILIEDEKIKNKLKNLNLTFKQYLAMGNLVIDTNQFVGIENEFIVKLISLCGSNSLIKCMRYLENSETFKLFTNEYIKQQDNYKYVHDKYNLTEKSILSKIGDFKSHLHAYVDITPIEILLNNLNDDSIKESLVSLSSSSETIINDWLIISNKVKELCK